MKIIELTRGYSTMVSDEDYEVLNEYSWCVTFSGTKFRRPYAVRGDWASKRLIYMHRQLCPPGVDQVVDHKNGNSLDNQRDNLRVCSHSQNNANKASFRSGLKGAKWRPDKKKWRSRIALNGKQYFLGHFDSEQEAHEAYCKAAEKLHGEFANTETKLTN